MNLVARYVLPYLKAHLAGLGAGITALLVDTSGNLNALGSLSGDQWFAALAATGLLGGLVGVTGNRPATIPAAAMLAPDPDPAPESVAPEDAVAA